MDERKKAAELRPADARVGQVSRRRRGGLWRRGWGETGGWGRARPGGQD